MSYRIFICLTIFSNMFPYSSYKKPIIIGHRGAPAYAPENTISSIKKALELKVPMIEFDVHQCASGELVVIHDFSVDNTTNGTGLVADMTYSELRALKIEENEYIPTLQEVLDVIDKKAIAVIELKGQNLAKPVAEVITEYINDDNQNSSNDDAHLRRGFGAQPSLNSLLMSNSFKKVAVPTEASREGWFYTDFLVVSFDHTQLQEIKKILPEIPIGPTCYGLPASPIQYMQALNANVLSLHPHFVTKKLIDEAHKNNIAIFIWYDPKYDTWAAQEAMKNGVDGLFADAPDAL